MGIVCWAYPTVPRKQWNGDFPKPQQPKLPQFHFCWCLGVMLKTISRQIKWQHCSQILRQRMFWDLRWFWGARECFATAEWSQLALASPSAIASAMARSSFAHDGDEHAPLAPHTTPWKHGPNTATSHAGRFPCPIATSDHHQQLHPHRNSVEGTRSGHTVPQLSRRSSPAPIAIATCYPSPPCGGSRYTKIFSLILSMSRQDNTK